MDTADFFLALKAPQEELRYYGAASGSGEYFVFKDFFGKNGVEIEVAIREKPNNFPFHKKPGQLAPLKEDQIALYENAIKDMQVGFLDKVVLSRVDNSIYFGDPLILLDQLCGLYPQAAVYLFSHPEVGTWIAASPETLIHLAEGELNIDSLAGTRAWEEREGFSEKEKAEQDLVSQEIRELLANTSQITAFEESALGVKKAGHLAHLHTRFLAKTSESFNMLRFLENLHPTPAVGGRPRAHALEFIKENELYQRRFYAGYFGLQRDKNAQFWVNLRCAEFCEPNTLAVYVGGGLTVQSDPESEWEETQTKAQTILKALN